MGRKRGTQAGFLFGMLLSGIILYFLLRSLDFAEVGTELSRINYWYLPGLVALLVASLWIRVLRWPYLLPEVPNKSPRESYSQGKMLKAVIIGFFASCVLPLRAGEFARPWVFSRWQPVSFGAAFASVVTERVFDIFGLLVMLLICLPEMEQAPREVFVGAQALSAVAVCVCAAMFCSYFYSDKLVAFVRLTMEKLSFGKAQALREKLLGVLGEFVFGLKAISSLKRLLIVLFWSIFLWFVSGVHYLFALWMFGETPPLLSGLVLSVLIAFAVAAPSAPGFVGTFQLGCVLALTVVYGYSREFAIAYSILTHVYQVVFFVLGGIWVLVVERLGIKCLQAGEEGENPPLSASPTK
jgi:uncharacterized protein (TIRG00374 family)